MNDSTEFSRKPCLAEVNFRIRNLVLVNRLTATPRKITNISCEMLVNYRWNWFWLSSQNSGLTFACQHVKFTWCRLLQPANREFRVGFHQLTKFLPTSIIKHKSMGYLLPCAIDFKTNHPPIYLQLGYFAYQLSRVMLFQWGHAKRKSLVRPFFAASASVWRTL